MPDREAALELVRHWSVIQIGAITPDTLRPWTISTKEFREDLTWAVCIAAETEISPAARQLLAELAARGIEIYAWE